MSKINKLQRKIQNTFSHINNTEKSERGMYYFRIKSLNNYLEFYNLRSKMNFS